ncbi:hypothetical protein HDV04_003055 [Boothiomyces sp. JEL0838]|nr:hypothetical protein HDV04_003055 [Boothiomyces sp. JEL0838]
MPSTFENQSKLPRLPIPTLEQTAKTYLESCKPLLTADEHAAYSKVVADFIKPNGLGQTLQKRLQEHDKTQPNSWLENWWYKYAYLSWRESVLVNSNWVLTGQHHPQAPAAKSYQEGFTNFQIYRAAGFASIFLDYLDLLTSETLPPEVTKQGPVDMNQYRNLFGITRVPKPECDIIVGSFPPKAKHIIVLAKDQIFVVYVYDDKTGKRLTVKEMERQFQDVVRRVESGKNKQPPICILGGQHRDKWAEHHQILLSLDVKNRESLNMIETALFAVSLDHRILPSDKAAVTRNVFHGYNGHNRWFDKSLSIVVANDGRLGLHGEHSPADALIPAYLMDFAFKNEPAKDPQNSTTTPTVKPIQRLEWVIDGRIGKAFEEAQEFIDKLIADSDMELIIYDKYGIDFIKSTAKVSPDAYVQMSLQLTFYRLHGHFSAVYETAATRKYLHGRTETCRSLTPEAKEFVETFENPNLPPSVKYQALQKAAKAHIAYISKASDGYGCDRHLLGLKLCLKPGESHPIFTDPAFAKTSKWQLSTSALVQSERLYGGGFGTVYPDGYGMNYSFSKTTIKAAIESKHSCPTTGSKKFKEAWAKSFDDMAAMCSAVNSKAKL